MFGGMNGISLADIAAVTRNVGGDGFGNGAGGWWVLIILLALFGGFGDGFGNNGGGRCNSSCQNAYDTQSVVQRGFDNQTVLTKLEGIQNGISSLGYDQLAQMNGINSNIMQTGFGIQQAINAVNIANMQNTNALSTQLSDCCCKTQTGFMNVINQMDKNNCATNNNILQSANAIMQNQNQGFQMLNNTIKDGFCNLEMREQQREIADLRQRLNDCNRDSALQGTANYIVNAVRPTPGPAWLVNNPWGCCNNVVGFQGNNCGGCNTCNTCCA